MGTESAIPHPNHHPATVKGDPRAADVFAIGDVWCYTLNRDAFNSLLGPLQVAPCCPSEPTASCWNCRALLPAELCRFHPFTSCDR